MKHCYLTVTKDWATAHEGTMQGANVLRTVTDKTGRVLISINAVNEFADLFPIEQLLSFTPVWLDDNDFPKVDSEPNMKTSDV